MRPQEDYDPPGGFIPTINPAGDPHVPPNGNGAVQMPRGGPPMPVLNGAGRHRNTGSVGAFEGPRSPPNAKNTSHVPCKFFKSGQCQAGKACPFAHTLEPVSDEVCRYFQKGNCKFGQKCALAHVLPNGRRVNRPPGAVRGNMELGSRIDPQLYRQSDPALAQSLLAQQATAGPPIFGQQFPMYSEHGADMIYPPPQAYDNIPTIDTDFASLPKFVSPPEERQRSAFSPPAYLGVLDAPLPASFDSQGISYIARHGPVAASMPSKLGFDLSSPPSSVPHRPFAPADLSRTLQGSFAAQRNPRVKGPDLGSSPLTSGDEAPSQRFMHSSRMPKTKMLSASLPRGRLVSDDWDDGFAFSEGEETDYIPTSLHDQILTPQEKMRRLSRHDPDNRSFRESLSGMATPADSSSKVNSPHTGSPSRYEAFFNRRAQENSINAAGSPFGHVGSPLRNLHPSANPTARNLNSENQDSSQPFSSFSSGANEPAMSILSQQLSRTRLSSKTGENPSEHHSSTANSNNLHPFSARHASAPMMTFQRSISSSTLGTANRIDEEHGENIFSMEEEEEERTKRLSGSHGNAWGSIGPRKGADWS